MSLLIIAFGVIAYYALPRCQNQTLTAVSLYVIWLAAGWYVCVFAALTLVIYGYQELLQRQRSRTVLFQPVALLVAVFLFLRSHWEGMMLPIGYSVFSFSAVSLIVDQYRSSRTPSFWTSATYLLFFPKIFAGPVVQSNQFDAHSGAKKPDCIVLYTGFKLLVFAAFVKWVLADRLLDFNAEAAGLNQAANILTFALRLFFDFWAYSLMAIGVGMFFGYRLPKNFNRPYCSQTFRDFWRRWNITLGQWLRDYVYIPLGGNRNKGMKWAVSVLLVFFISGLWHGSSIPFIAWGICHGLLYSIERFIVKPHTRPRLFRWIYMLAVLLTVSVLWQLFIVDSWVGFLSRLTSISLPADGICWPLLTKLSAGIVLMVLLASDKVDNLLFKVSNARRDVICEAGLLTFMLLGLLLFNGPESFNFFYFRF